MTKKPKGYFEITNAADQTVNINIVGSIAWWKNNSEDFIRQIDQHLKNGVENVKGYIQGPGGSMEHGNEIGNQIERFPGKKHAVIGSLAASATFIVASHFDTIEVHPNTMGMTHDPIVGLTVTHLKDFKTFKSQYQGFRDNAIDQLAKKFKTKTHEEVDRMMENTTWFTGKKLVELGFADGMLKDKAKVSAQMVRDLKNQLGEGVEIPQMLNEIIDQEPPDNEDSNSNQNTPSMKNIAVKLGLPEDATEEQIVAKMEENDQSQLENQAESEENGIEALVQLAERKGFKADFIRNQAKENYQVILDMVKEAPEPTVTPAAAGPDNERVSDAIKDHIDKSGGTQSTLTIDNIDLDKMEKESPEAVAKLINETPELYQKAWDKAGREPISLEEIKNLKV